MLSLGLVAVLAGAAALAWPRSSDAAARLTGMAAAGSAPGSRRGVRRIAEALLSRRRAHGWAESAQVDRDLLDVLEGLAATLRAGLTPARAFARLASAAAADVDAPEPLGGLVARLAAQAAAGARLEPVWRAAAERSRSRALLAVAEGWGMSERHGAPVVDVLDALVAALRDRARTDAAVRTALAAPRATATLLGVLPIGGVLLGELVGVHPLSVLVGSPVGRVAGALGLAATVGGRVWMRRLVGTAARG